MSAVNSMWGYKCPRRLRPTFTSVLTRSIKALLSFTGDTSYINTIGIILVVFWNFLYSKHTEILRGDAHSIEESDRHVFKLPRRLPPFRFGTPRIFLPLKVAYKLDM
jgi:hypothetical protein